LNASMGSKIWSYTIGNYGFTFSTPAVADGKVYFGSTNGNVYALDAATGTKVWNFTTGAEIESSPAVAAGAVYIGSDDDCVYALNPETGAKIWAFKTGNIVDSSPCIISGAVYVGSEDSYIYALNPASGAKIWSYLTGSAVESFPSVANGVLYIGSDDDNVYAFGTINLPQPSLTVPSGSSPTTSPSSIPEYPVGLIAAVLVALPSFLVIANGTRKRKKEQKEVTIRLKIIVQNPYLLENDVGH